MKRVNGNLHNDSDPIWSRCNPTEREKVELTRQKSSSFESTQVSNGAAAGDCLACVQALVGVTCNRQGHSNGAAAKLCAEGDHIHLLFEYWKLIIFLCCTSEVDYISFCSSDRSI